MVTFKIKDVLFFNEKKNVNVLDSEDRIIAKVMKASNSENENGKTFVLERNGEQTVLGIKKGRLIFADYRFLINGEEYILKDNKINSLLYFCVDGMALGKKLRIEENWNKEIEVKVDGQKVALIKPNTSSLEATVVMEEEASRQVLLFSLTCLIYFMFMIYKNESKIIESIIDEVGE
ncbi:hypothetical protein MNQ98_15175 [Paenibacillus sp. N3/727]|uniref:hypothetical protein n=1 Tax=Paenibacillus sp. N3/727 TaxID=2925845 RepID=UPI001F530A6F|nr:hypothetical protein [Paenibacillus sp. N3/727]UNK15900.1 hypothetical protein MNQ98_15175 [Paenibacillus sp. N3/727]